MPSASMRAHRPSSGPAILEGMPASPGRATGVARVLTDPAGAGRLAPRRDPGTTATTPAWAPLFSRAATRLVRDSKMW